MNLTHIFWSELIIIKYIYLTVQVLFYVAVDHHSDGSGNRSAPVSTPVEQPATVVMPLMTTSQLTSSITGVVSTAETPLDGIYTF